MPLTYRFFLIPAYSTHLAGGTIRVICVGGNEFKIQLIKYRDPQGAATIGPGDIIVMGTNTQNYSTTLLSHNPQLPQPNNNACWALPAASYLEEFVYETSVIALDSGTSYYLYHMDNARNSTNTIPIQATMVLYTEFGDPAIVGCNNSPVFNEHPPMATCLNQSMQYDASATDPDGDVLEYRFCDALTGSNFPFFPAQYSGGFSSSYPVSSNPPLAIDQNTGLVTGTPNLIGSYGGRWTVNYCVDEYRNGVKIGQYNREVQMTVTSCNNPVTANVGSSYTSIALGIDVVASCDDFTVKFKNTSNGGAAFFWDFGVAGIDTDTSSQFDPSYTYPDTGTFQVKLVVNPGDTCVDSTFMTVLVYPDTNADFSYSAPACQGTPVSFTDQSTPSYGSPIFWIWQFGDGSSSNQQNPTYTYEIGGDYTARLIVESSLGCRDTVDKLIQITAINLDLGKDRTICDSILLWAPVGAAFYEWQDGSTGQSYNVTTAGSYSVTVVDTSGCAATDAVSLKVDKSPHAAFSFDTTNCPEVVFTNLSTGTSPIYLWDFDDGYTSYVPSPSNTFRSNGLYVVFLTAFNPCNASSVSDTVGIDCYPDGIANPTENVWRVYPNPATTVLYLEHLLSMDHQTEVSIINAIGQQLLKKGLDVSIVGLNIQHLPSGMYFLEMLHNGERQVLPVSIIR